MSLHALYRVGLLGYVQHDLVRGEWRQRFLRPGEATLEPSGVLPRATHYLIHPVLSDVIGRINPAFLQRIDRSNIVGYDRPWHEPGNVDRVECSAPMLCPEGGCARVRQPDARRHGRAGQKGAGGSGNALGPGGSDRRNLAPAMRR